MKSDSMKPWLLLWLLLMLGMCVLTASRVCVLFLPGEVEDSDTIDTLGQLDGPDSPLPTLKGKTEAQLSCGDYSVLALSLSLGVS